MSKAAVSIRRGPGRPKQDGRGVGLMVRVHAPLLTALDRYVDQLGEDVSRPEAMRRIVMRSLEKRGPAD